jgi:hypothetical protein
MRREEKTGGEREKKMTNCAATVVRKKEKKKNERGRIACMFFFVRVSLCVYVFVETLSFCVGKY